MRYADQVLVRNYCRLGLEIAKAKNPTAKHDVSEAETLKRGYLLIKQRLEQLGPVKREQYRQMLRNEIEGVRVLMKRAHEAGDTTFTLADIEIEMFDLESGEAIPDRPNVQEQDNDADATADTTADQAPHPPAAGNHASDSDR